MTTQFVKDYNHVEDMGILVLPDYYHINYYNNKDYLYLINNNRVKRKLYICRERGSEEWSISGPRWNNFIEQSGYLNIRTLHFIKEAADTFFVTAYDVDGWESGGYGIIHTRNRLVRCIAEVGMDRSSSTWFPAEFLQGVERNDFVIEFSDYEIYVVANRGVIPGTLDSIGFQFNVHWNTVVHRENLMVGERVVLTKKTDMRLALMRFDNDGFQLIHEQHYPTRLAFVQGHDANEPDERLVHGCNWFQHGVHLTKENTFYKRLFPFVVDCRRMTIPSGFVSDNNLQQFTHALLRRMDSERRVVMKIEHHADRPWRNGHMNFRTNWRTLAEDFQFSMNKMIRFQMVGTTVDPTFEVQLFNGPIPLVAVFDVC